MNKFVISQHVHIFVSKRYWVNIKTLSGLQFKLVNIFEAAVFKCKISFLYVIIRAK